MRWFTEGSLPAGIVDWFEGHEPDPEIQPRRVDYYFRVVGVDSIGIKLREGKIELKQRQRQLGVIRLHERVHGILEEWSKWSFGLAESAIGTLVVDLPSSGWIRAEKERAVRRYGLSDSGIHAASRGYYPVPGCAWELTEVDIAGSSWWSLGFEAFGSKDGLQDLLFRVALRTLLETEPPTFAADNSFGYPELLEVLGRRV